MSGRANNKKKIVLTLQDDAALTFYHDRWRETSMPATAITSLGRIERAADAANVLHELLMIDADNTQDAAENEVEYHGLNHRQRWSIFNAQHFLIDGIAKDIEELREAFTPSRAGGEP